MSVRPLKVMIHEITGLRAFAAYLVFIHHFHYIISDGFPLAVKRYLNEFNIGLPMFFVLAGFSITYRNYDKFALTSKWFFKYMQKRVARIYPVYLLVTLIAFGWNYFEPAPVVTGGIHPIAAFLLNITFLRGFFDDLKFTGVGQGWSLSVNMTFYILVPLIFFAIRRWQTIYWQPFVFTAVGLLLVGAFSNVSFYGFFGNNIYMMLYSFFGRALEFFGGIGIALLVKKRGFSRVTQFNLTYTGFGIILLCVYLLSILPLPVNHLYRLQSTPGFLINNYIIGAASTMMFLGLITEKTWLKKILASKPFDILGKSSYAFYLIHLGPINNGLHRLMNWLNDRVFAFYDRVNLDWHSPFESDRLNLLYVFILLNLIAIFIFTFIEEPLNNYIRKKDFTFRFFNSGRKVKADLVEEKV